jgi:hypothetical protein
VFPAVLRVLGCVPFEMAIAHSQKVMKRTSLSVVSYACAKESPATVGRLSRRQAASICHRSRCACQ